MATINKLVDQLLEAGVQETKTALRKKSREELEEMVANIKPAVETEVDVEAEVAVEEKAEGEVVHETSHQLGIFTEFIYHTKNEGADIVVENAGMGDAYISDKATKVGATEDRVLFGEQRVFKGAKVLRMVASSQPVIKIKEVK